MHCKPPLGFSSAYKRNTLSFLQLYLIKGGGEYLGRGGEEGSSWEADACLFAVLKQINTL